MLTRDRLLLKHLGTLHFIGIGGIGMSGIAEILHNLGYMVQGSDLSDNYVVERLKGLGIRVLTGHQAENVANASLVIKSSAVRSDNPEIIAAQARNIPIILRAEMLAELMRLKTSIAIAGSHGKTTTTSLVTAILAHAGFDPTVINGGIINAYGTNAHMGAGDFLVAEADESDGSFLKLPATIAVVTNIDPEHMDHYGNFAALVNAFRQFVARIPFYGFGVLCADHPVVAELATTIVDRKIRTYGLDQPADITAHALRPSPQGTFFDVHIAGRLASDNQESARVLKDCFLAMPGRHNVQNALAAITVALELGVSDVDIQKGFKNFEGVKRRFTCTGSVGGIDIIDDYAHHPKEIEATLAAARDVVTPRNGRILAVFQPHRYSRVQDLFDAFVACFAQADRVWISDIYSAGEAPIPHITAPALVEAIERSSLPKPVLGTSYLAHPSLIAAEIANIAEAGDLVLCMGAGDITKWAYALPEQLAALSTAHNAPSPSANAAH